MSLWLQNLLAILAVAGCGVFLGRRAWKSLTAKGCSSGCGHCSAAKKPAQSTQRTVFLPVEMLARKK